MTGGKMAKITGAISASDGDSGASALFNAESNKELDIEVMFDVPVKISVVLGKTDMSIDQLLHLENGNIIELERKIGEDVDVYVNGRIIAKGEIVIVDENIGITLTEIIKS
jgi:flagellar motor switch protein FliN/FliY